MKNFGIDARFVIDTDDKSVSTKLSDVQESLTTISTNLADIAINVKSKGAKGDGVTDDSPVIQAAIDSIKNTGGTIYFPHGTYNINTPLNLTNISKGLVCKGAGMNDNGTIIYGLTNGSMLDCAGSPYMQIKDIQLKARYESNASKIGILFARTTNNQYVEFSSLDNVKIDLGSIPTANNNNGTIGIYNFGAELHRYRNIYVIADRTVCFVLNNTFGITSPFTTLNASGVSMSECVIDGSSTLTGYAFPSVRLDNTCNIKLDNIYMILGQPVGSNNTFAIESINSQTNLEITGHIESYPQFINAVGSILAEVYIRVSKQIMSASQDQIVLDGTVTATYIQGGYISVYPMLNPTLAHAVVSQIGNNHNGVVNTDIRLYQNQALYIGYGYSTGTVIRSELSNPTVSVPGNGFNDGTILISRGQTHSLGKHSFDLLTLGDAFYMYGGAPPTGGTYKIGDRVKNNFPTAGGYEGWICVTAGTPGTWKGYGAIQA